MWAAENGDTAALHAFDPANLAVELYNSNQMGTRDQFGAGNKFITPMIVNGKVYVGTTNGVAVFGLYALAVSSCRAQRKKAGTCAGQSASLAA